MSKKKAYQITEGYYADCAFVVFAESANKAKSIGLGLFRYANYDCRYIDIKAERMPLLDKFYKGEEEIDYYNPEVKKILVEEYGWDYAEEGI